MSQRFAVLHVCPFLKEDGYIIECWTNTPCHLWLRYTAVTPVTHKETVLRRGLAMHQNPRFCFVAHNDLEQHEPGDTLHHSFNLHPIPKFSEVHFYFWGTINNEESPSTSAMMHYPLEVWRAEMWRKEVGLAASGMAVTYRRPRSQRFLYVPPYKMHGFRIWCYGYNPKYSVTFGLYKSGLYDAPTGEPLRYTTLAHIPYKNLWPNYGYLFIPMPYYPAVSPDFYHLVVYGDPEYPDDNVFWWSRHPLPPTHEGEFSFYSIVDGPPWWWVRHGVSNLQYQVYSYVEGAEPCHTLPLNITP